MKCKVVPTVLATSGGEAATGGKTLTPPAKEDPRRNVDSVVGGSNSAGRVAGNG